jgi:hypothetical protein
MAVWRVNLDYITVQPVCLLNGGFHRSGLAGPEAVTNACSAFPTAFLQRTLGSLGQGTSGRGALSCLHADRLGFGVLSLECSSHPCR